MAQTRIRLTESELRNMIMEAVEEELANESWWTRTFGGKQSRGNAQMQDAIKLIQQSDQLIQQFRSAMQAAGTAAQAWNPQQQQGAPQQGAPQQGQQQQVKESETNEFLLPLLGGLAGAGALGWARRGRNFLGGSGDKNYQLVAQAYKLRSDAYSFIARAISNGVPIDFSTFEDKLLGVTPQKAQAVSGQAPQGQQQGAAAGATDPNAVTAKTSQEAQAEIGKVVGSNFSGWPQKCKQAGWSDQKIAAYRSLINNAAKGSKPAAAPAAAPAATGTAAPAAAPAGGNTATAQPQQQQVTEAVINRVVKDFINRK